MIFGKDKGDFVYCTDPVVGAPDTAGVAIEQQAVKA
jgi:hypothetical protein